LPSVRLRSRLPAMHIYMFHLMPSPNIMAAALVRRTKRAKLVILDNVITLYENPLRVAEEVAVLDVITGGRIISGQVVDTGNEFHSYNVNPTYARERFSEAHEPIVEAADHADRQAALAVQHLGDARAGADDWLESLPGESLLLHPKQDCFDGIGRVHRVMFGLVSVDERCQHVEAVALGRAGLRSPHPLDLGQRRFVVGLRPYRLQLTRGHAPPPARRCDHTRGACRST
jgi:hypothetical protein